MSKKIKVYIDVFYLQAALSGIRTYTKELAMGLSAFGDNTVEYVFSHELQTILNKTSFLNPENRWKRLIFHAYYAVWKQVILPFKVLKSGANVLICPDYIAPIWKLKAHKISVVHDNLFWAYPENYNSLWRRYYLKQLQLGFRGSSSIVTTSRTSKKNIKPHVPLNSCIDVVYQSFNTSNISNDEDSAAISQFQLTPKKYVLHVGSFDPRKDLITLVKAMKHVEQENGVDELKLVLAGETVLNGDASVFNEIQKYCVKHELADKVVCTGYISEGVLQALYTNAMLLVFPSKDEGFGIPILEAFSKGLPVLVSNCEAFVEVAADAAAQFPVGDSRELANRITELYRNPLQREHLVACGTERLKRFSRAQFAKSMEQVVLKHTLLKSTQQHGA